MKANFIKYIAIGFLGPLITYLCYFKSEAGTAGFFDISIPILIAIFLTIFIGVIIQRKIESIAGSLFLSFFLSEIMYVLMLFCYVYFGNDAQDRYEDMMWLPVMIFFLVIHTFPMALTVSYGSIGISREFRKSRRIKEKGEKRG